MDAKNAGGASPDRASDRPKIHAVQYLLSLEPGKHTLVCVGPLTNIAVAISIDPQFLLKFKQVYVMGGSLLAQGNSSIAVSLFMFVV